MTFPISQVQESYNRSSTFTFKLGDLLGREVINLRNSLKLLGLVTIIIGIFYIFRSKSSNGTNKLPPLPKPIQNAKGVATTTNLDKSYHLNDPQMLILHKEILRGADLSSKQPLLTQICYKKNNDKLTIFQICNYTRYEVTFDSKRYLWIYDPKFIHDQNPNDIRLSNAIGHFTPDNCQLIVYQLPHLSHMIIVEQKDIGKAPSERIIGFLHYTNYFFEKNSDSRMKEKYLNIVFQFSELIFARSVIPLLILAYEKENSPLCLIPILPKEIITYIIKLFYKTIPITERPDELYKKYALQPP